MTPPPVVPYSAEYAEVCTVNSCTVSGEKLTIVRARLTPVLFVPSAMNSVFSGRPPLTLILQPGQVVTLTIDGILAARDRRDTLGSVIARSSTLRFNSGTSCNLARRDRAAGGARIHVEHRRFRRYRHLRIHRAGLQRHIDRAWWKPCPP